MKLTTTLLLAACLVASAVPGASAFAFSPAAPPAPSPTRLRMSAVEGASASAGGASAGGGDVNVADVNVAEGERQKLYGRGLDLPATYVRCGRCSAAYALMPDDLGTRGKGRRVECSVCSHSWYQARDRLFDVNAGFELIPFPQSDLDRIASNIEAGRSPDFAGVAKFYVGNLNYGCGEDDLREAFGAVGSVGDVSLITDDAGRSRGFAFVTMMTEEDGRRAMELDGTEVMGRKISVRPPNN